MEQDPAGTDNMVWESVSWDALVDQIKDAISKGKKEINI